MRLDLLQLSIALKDMVVKITREFDSGEIQLAGGDLKGEHKADHAIYQALVAFFAENPHDANVFVEGNPPILSRKPARMSILIDPVDGSLNRDLRVGDPGVCIAFAGADKSAPTFGDIFGGYVYGLHSGDAYFSDGAKTHYLPSGSTHYRRVSCDSSVTRLGDAILYYNDGYGVSLARHAFARAGILPFLVRHHNAFDNAALEICQMSRGAAHLRVEARSHFEEGRLKGSDQANILAAFAIGRGAGLLMTDLGGNSLDGIRIELDKAQDFICCSNQQLLDETLDALSRNRELLAALMDAWPSENPA